jgi:diacylglycerol kinase (ATP)
VKYRFILNPISGKNRDPKKIRSLINHVFDQYEFDVVETKTAKDATRLAKDAVKDSVDIVVAIGGDGTINEVAAGIIGTETALAVIPAGSGNGYARNIGLSLDQEKAIKSILNSNKVITDTLLVNKKLTVGVFGVGFDAHIAHLFSKHGKRGAWPYFKISMIEFFKYKAENYLVKNGDFEFNGPAHLIVAAKSSQFGNGATIAPKADLVDGFFDLVLVKPLSFFSAMFFSLRLFNKTIDKSASVVYKKFKKISIEKHGDIFIHLDGEPFVEKDRLEIELIEKNLKVMIPNAD